VSESPALTNEMVASVYRQVLGRDPGPGDAEAQLAAVPDLDMMLRVALESEEYAVRLRDARSAGARTRGLVNIHHEDLAAYGPRPGTGSEDGSAIVGNDGTLFLCGGTNAILDQYLGAVEMPPHWLEDWRQVVLRRHSEMDAMGLAHAMLVVPDKLAVYEERYPETLEKVGPRPIERLAELPEEALIYPLAGLRAAAAAEDMFPPTDTHLTFRGNELLFRTLIEPLGIAAMPDLAALPMHSYPVPGDLGVKFNPEILSIISEPGTLRTASIVEDNRGEMEAAGRHVGTRRVFRNDLAPDPRVAVLFGDSFGFAGDSYQGISWFMAQVFREVHFIWVPLGWDPDYVREAGAQVVLVEGAERFVARVPEIHHCSSWAT
jgi:alginate O-acetyltransferase complex protein AlgJ